MTTVQRACLSLLSEITRPSSQANSTMAPASINPTPLNPSGNVLPLMIHVTAPATLPEGYTFEAAINGDESKLVNIEVVCAFRTLLMFIQKLFISLILLPLSTAFSPKGVSKKDRSSSHLCRKTTWVAV